MDTDPLRGRGAGENPGNRFDRLHVAVDPDLEIDPGERAAMLATEYFRDASRTVVSFNDSPDVGFEASLNPYRGCEHGCIYCYARPTHEFLGLSSGLDFETRIFVKADAPAQLADALRKRSWTPQTLVLSGVTDPYQPVERVLRVTRGCLELLRDCRHPVSIITKSALVTRDIDLLAELASFRAASVALSVTSLDESLRRTMEPRAATAERRLDAVARLNQAGIPTGVMVAPVIPGLNDHEIPRILEAAAGVGARFASYTLVRLPHAVKELFAAWLERNYPDAANKVLGRIRDIRGGKLNDPNFGSRMRGNGPLAELVAEVFKKARDRAGIPRYGPTLSTSAFRPPSAQGRLFE